MKYALAISATEDKFAAAYVSIYSFIKQHKSASVLLFGDKPDIILDTIGVNYIGLAEECEPKPKDIMYTNNLVIAMPDGYDAFVIAKPDVLYNRSLADLIAYAVQSKHALGSIKSVNNRMLMDSSLYIVPTNAINSKIKQTIINGTVKSNEEAVLVDAYYPVLIDMLNSVTLTVEPGVSVSDTNKRIIHYSNNAWKSTADSDLWTKVGEELIDNLGKV